MSDPGTGVHADVDDAPTPDVMISTSEAAVILDVNPRTVERWVDSRKLRGGRPGGQVARLDPKLAAGLAAELDITETDLAAAVERVRERLGRTSVRGSHRWVDARHAVALAVEAGRAHLIPERWRHLIPQRNEPVAG